MKLKTLNLRRLSQYLLASLTLPQAQWVIMGVWGLLALWFIYTNVIQVVREPVQLPPDTTRDVRLDGGAAQVIQARYQKYFNYIPAGHHNALLF